MCARKTRSSLLRELDVHRTVPTLGRHQNRFCNHKLRRRASGKAHSRGAGDPQLAGNSAAKQHFKVACDLLVLRSFWGTIAAAATGAGTTAGEAPEELPPPCVDVAPAELLDAPEPPAPPSPLAPLAPLEPGRAGPTTVMRRVVLPTFKPLSVTVSVAVYVPPYS